MATREKFTITVDADLAQQLRDRVPRRGRSHYIERALISQLLHDSEPVEVPGLDEDLDTLRDEAWNGGL